MTGWETSQLIPNPVQSAHPANYSLPRPISQQSTLSAEPAWSIPELNPRPMLEAQHSCCLTSHAPCAIRILDCELANAWLCDHHAQNAASRMTKELSDWTLAFNRKTLALAFTWTAPAPGTEDEPAA